MRIQHNIMAMSAYRNYTNNVSAMQKNLEKLSSGYKINRAGDDAAGLAISEKMRAQITGLETAQKNAKDGISLVKTAEGALTEVHDMLNRMVELATQSANGTYDDKTDRSQMQKEVNQLLDEINRIADSSNFNGINLLDGSLGLNQTSFEVNAVMAADQADVSSQIVTDIAPASQGHQPTSSAAGAATILHGDSTSPQVGKFVVYLNQVQLGAGASASSNSIKITVGSAVASVAWSTTGGAMTASAVAAKMAGTSGVGAFLYVKASGTYGFASTRSAAATAAGAKGLIYSASASGGNITYTLTHYVDASSSAQSITASTGAELTLDNVDERAANLDLNFDVKVQVDDGPVTNIGNVGTNPTQTVLKKLGDLGSTELTIDTTKLTDGMKIRIGAGSTAEEKTIRLTGTAATDGSEIDLTDLDVSASADAIEIIRRIANAYADSSTGIDVGVNAAGKLTLSEQADASSGESTAPTAVQTAMRTEGGFKGLVQFTQDSVDAGATVKVKDATAIAEGDAINVVDNATGKATKYTFTKDAANQGKDGYIYIKDMDAAGVANAVKTALGSKASLVDNQTVKITGNYSVLGRGLTLQLGETSDPWNQLNVGIQDMHAQSLGISGLDISSEAAAQNAIDKIKSAINTVSDVRGTLGATQNRLDHTINNLSVMTENIQDAESTIRDVDVAEEMMAYTKNNILIQSAQAMLAQANQVPQGVLQLLG